MTWNLIFFLQSKLIFYSSLLRTFAFLRSLPTIRSYYFPTCLLFHWTFLKHTKSYIVKKKSKDLVMRIWMLLQKRFHSIFVLCMPVEYIHTRGRPYFLNALFSLGGLFVVASGYALMHTVSSQDFRSLSTFYNFSQLGTAIFCTAYFFFVRSQCSVLK